MRVCIVGASGKLGQYMVQHALDRGYEVVGVCRQESVGKLDRFKGRIAGQCMCRPASAGDVGGRHLDERHDCEQHGDDGSCDKRAGEPGDGSGRAGEMAGGGGGRGRWATPRPRSSRPQTVAGSTRCGTSVPRPRWRSAVTRGSRPQSPSPTGTARGSSSSPPWPSRSRFRPASPQMGVTATLTSVPTRTRAA